MTQTTDVPAREPVSQNLSETAGLGLELRPETLRPRAALLHGAIDDRLIPCLKVKESHPPRRRCGNRHFPVHRACSGVSS